ncbi:vacuolar protein sorting-associated protein 37B isoform X2 [Corvus kubaryi]|uniref:vacuolar protein sorting-associated protein 37B isoform X2 n=1 Tax=Corvus kubaryi TaxID=68294 RepID=UPI001C05046D|nr:vacuolar protein sorting-associated protein 37B isoform X2 [Corvus kubaryi]
MTPRSPEPPGRLRPAVELPSQNVQHSKDMTLASNRSLAEGNLLYQPKLESLKSNLTEKYQELQVLFEAYQIKKTKLDRQSSNASLETLLALLQTEGAKIEEDTENMAEKFLDGEIPLDSFIDEYQSKRKLAHLRRVKIEKLQEMVLKGQRLPQVQAPAQPRAPETAAAPADPYKADANTPPSVVPRRIPPPPPPSGSAGRFPTPFTAAMSSGPALSYPGAPYPPLPPRPGGAQPTSQMPQPGYPAQFVPPYPPPLPQRPARLPPHPGFILQ